MVLFVVTCATSIVVFAQIDKETSALLLVVFASAVYFLHLNIYLVLHNRRGKGVEKNKMEGTEKKKSSEYKRSGEPRAG